MALASIPASPADGSVSPVDAYLLEVYRQAAETARPSVDRRLSSIGAFLTFVGLLTAALAMLFSVPEGSSNPLMPAVCVVLGVIGLLVSIAFYAQELHRHKASGGEVQVDGPTDAASSIYQASIGFFAFAVFIGTALLLVR